MSGNELQCIVLSEIEHSLFFKALNADHPVFADILIKEAAVLYHCMIKKPKRTEDEHRDDLQLDIKDNQSGGSDCNPTGEKKQQGCDS